MPFYKFKKNDVYINTLKTYPEIKYFIYNGAAYYNNTPDISGSLTSSVRCTDPGSISLFELNVDRRTESLDEARVDDGYITKFINEVDNTVEDIKSVTNTGLIYQFMAKDATRMRFSAVSTSGFAAGQEGQIFTGSYPYTSRISREYYSASAPRAVSSSILPPGAPGNETGDDPLVTNPGSVSHLRALKNTINHYYYLSPHFSYGTPGIAAQAWVRLTGPAHHKPTTNQTITLISTDGTSVEYTAKDAQNVSANEFAKGGNKLSILESLKACIEDSAGHGGKILARAPAPLVWPNYEMVLIQAAAGPAGNTAITEDLLYVETPSEFELGADGPGDITRDFDNIKLGLISIPTIFYGSRIKPGSMKLGFYVTGALIGLLEDKNHDGVLYQTAPVGSYGSGSIAGIALYNEGFIILTGSWDITNGQHTEPYYTTSPGVYGAAVPPAWVYWGASLDPVTNCSNSSFLLEMSGTSKIETLCMFATAPKALLNQSNNPTFINFVTGAFSSTSSTSYIQNQNIGIKNVVSSSYNTPTGSFDRTTYISKVGIYDKDMNLIAIAKPATPIKKTAARDFTFKIELDI
jgi:hypothetical protein